MNVRKPLLWSLGALFIAIVGAGAFYYLVLRSNAPPPVNLGDALASVAESERTARGGLVSSDPGGADTTDEAAPADSNADDQPTPSAEPTSADSTSAASTATPTGTTEPADSPTGTSTAAPTASPTVEATATPPPSSGTSLVGSWRISDQGQSFLGYRVREELARVGFQTAVGRTTAVTGSLFFDGQSITSVHVEGDLSQLVSDDVRRENHLRGQSLETELYPIATFDLAVPISVGANIAEGVPISVTAIGDLTIHGVTQRVAIPLEGQLSGGLVVVVGSLEIQFADYDIDTPDSGLVLSVEDHGIMELQLIFEHD